MKAPVLALALTLAGVPRAAAQGLEPLGDWNAGSLSISPALLAETESAVYWQVQSLGRQLWRVDARGARYLETRSDAFPSWVAVGDRLFSLEGGALVRWEGELVSTRLSARGSFTQLVVAGEQLFGMTEGPARIWSLDPDTGVRALRAELPAGAEIRGWRAEGLALVGMQVTTDDRVLVILPPGARETRVIGHEFEVVRPELHTLRALGGGRWFFVAYVLGVGGPYPHVADATGEIARFDDRSLRVNSSAGTAVHRGRGCFALASGGVGCTDGLTVERSGSARLRRGGLWSAGETLFALGRDRRLLALRDPGGPLESVLEGGEARLATTEGAIVLRTTDARAVRVDAATLEVREVEGGTAPLGAAARDDGEVWGLFHTAPGELRVLAVGPEATRPIATLTIEKNASSYPFGPFRAGGASFIAASVGGEDAERVWVRLGPEPEIVDRAPIGWQTAPVAAGGKLFYVEARGTRGRFLMVLDETGLRPVRAFGRGVGAPVVAGDRVFLPGFTFDGTTRLYASDGTREGTGPLVPGLDPDETLTGLVPTTAGLELVATSTRTSLRHFRSWRPATGLGPRRSAPPGLVGDPEDGWGAGTSAFVRVQNALWRIYPRPRELAAWSPRLRAAPLGEALVLLEDGRARIFGPNDEAPREVRFEAEAPAPLTEVDGRLFFSAVDEAGRELWVLEGAAARRVADLAPGRASSAPAKGAAVDGRLVFNAWEAEHGRETWISDGTLEGTRRLFDLSPGSFDGAHSELPPVGGYVADGPWIYFAGRTLETGLEPWRFPRAWVTSPPPAPPPPPLESSPRGCGCRAGPPGGGAAISLLFALLALAARPMAGRRKGMVFWTICSQREKEGT